MVVLEHGNVERNMTGRSQKPPSVAPRKPKPSQQDDKHLNDLLDEALKETFPASDPPAMLEPVPDPPLGDKEQDK